MKQKLEFTKRDLNTQYHGISIHVETERIFDTKTETDEYVKKYWLVENNSGSADFIGDLMPTTEQITEFRNQLRG